jgi:uncharacterized protein YqeY
MTLIDTLRQKALAAMKAKDPAAATILRLAQSEVSAAELRAGRALTDDEAYAVVRKLVKSNEETLASGAADATVAATLTRENALLTELLPKGLGPAEIQALLAPIADAIRAAGGDGQATGVAMKHLKASGAAGVNGVDVALAVKAIRA